MLQWKPRLVALIAVVALIMLALTGLGYEDFLSSYNLYW